MDVTAAFRQVWSRPFGPAPERGARCLRGPTSGSRLVARRLPRRRRRRRRCPRRDSGRAAAQPWRASKRVDDLHPPEALAGVQSHV